MFHVSGGKVRQSEHNSGLTPRDLYYKKVRLGYGCNVLYLGRCQAGDEFYGC